MLPRLHGMRSRFGARTLALFVACALVPVTLLAGWAYAQIRGVLLERAQVQVELAAKEYAVGLVDRASTVRDLFELLPTSTIGTTLSQRLGPLERAPLDTGMMADSAIARRLHERRAVLHVEEDGAGVTLWLVRLAPGADHEVLRAAMPVDPFAGFRASDPLDPAICVLHRSGRILSCSDGVSDAERQEVTRRGALPDGTSGLLMAVRSSFLRYELGAGEFFVVAFRRREEVLDAVTGAGNTFALVAALSLLAVFLVSHVQIRRVTAPLDALAQATQRIRDGRFDTQLAVASTDEFGAVAAGFNRMSDELGRRIGTLRAIQGVDRAALEGQGADTALRVALARIDEITRGRALAILGPSGAAPARAFVRAGTPPSDPPDVLLQLNGAVGDPWSRWLDTATQRVDPGVWYAYPIRTADRNEGILCAPISRDADPAIDHECRTIADRLAVALANMRLVTELDAFNTGALTAFARIVDANSTWTAGHSERVTCYAAALGARLGAGATEMEMLRRGALLHDIGKIGVPVTILDKPGQLTEAERQAVENHTTLGYEILAPLAALRDVLPIVRSHHERLDGGGYPDGLAGDEIPWLVRIVKVADVYDALVSDRPYRAGLDRASALAMMHAQTGTAFDPDILRCFLELAAEGGLREIEGMTRSAARLTGLGVLA